MNANHPHLTIGSTFSAQGNRHWRLLEAPQLTDRDAFGYGHTFIARAAYTGINGPAIVTVMFPRSQVAD